MRLCKSYQEKDMQAKKQKKSTKSLKAGKKLGHIKPLRDAQTGLATGK